MDAEKKTCCARSALWIAVGIVIAVAWGIGNFSNNMDAAEAFAIPALIVFAIISVVALAELKVAWFRKSSLREWSNTSEHRPKSKTFVSNH